MRSSRRLGRVELGLEASHLITQQKPTLLQSTHDELIAERIAGGAVDETVEIGVLDAQLDQATREGVKVVVHPLCDYVADFDDRGITATIIVLGL